MPPQSTCRTYPEGNRVTVSRCSAEGERGMGVSSTSPGSWNIHTVNRVVAAVVVFFALGFYLYGPPATPRLHEAAAVACNDYAGGNYRDYRLSWHVGASPHWTCWNARRPMMRAVDMGWTVSLTG